LEISAIRAFPKYQRSFSLPKNQTRKEKAHAKTSPLGYDTRMKAKFFLLCGGVVVALAACGGGGSSSSPSPNTGNTNTGTTPLPAVDRLKTPSIGGALNETNCQYKYNFQNASSTTGTDPLLTQQWHLQNTGQPISGLMVTAGEDLKVIQAWAQNRGEGVRVAVVDDAIETIHADLAPNVVVGGSYNYRTTSPYALYPLPCFKYTTASGVLVDDNHGTAVAGIIVARDGNGIGGAGVAPRAQLVAYNALSTETDADIADALTRDLSNNAIVHNSWGSNDDGKLHSADAPFIAAIAKGIESGRNGKGTIYVFPAGNGGCYLTSGSPAACSDDNANLDGYTNKLGQITVGAVGPDGKRLSYSEPGANILVSAPAEDITTTTVFDSWRADFRGTSASAPMISGVVALMLSANPQLSWRDVKLILAKSAKKTHPTDPSWITANGYNFNQFYGFGVPDANQAVTIAKTWATVGTSATLKSCGPFVRNVNTPLLDAPLVGREVTDTVTVDALNCGITKIEFIEVLFTASHAYSGDLRIALESPNGLVSNLAQRRSCNDIGDACRPYANWQFGSVRHLDESSIGQWKLKVADEAPKDTGTWTNWSIKFYGR
jgi:proprotein convertase subtilisin/kexin type 2